MLHMVKIELRVQKYNQQHTSNLTVNAGDLIGKCDADLIKFRDDIKATHSALFERIDPRDTIIRVLNSPVVERDDSGAAKMNKAGKMIPKRIRPTEQARIFRILDKIEGTWSSSENILFELNPRDASYLASRMIEFLEDVYYPKRIYVYLHEYFNDLNKQLKEE